MTEEEDSFAESKLFSNGEESVYRVSQNLRPICSNRQPNDSIRDE